LKVKTGLGISKSVVIFLLFALWSFIFSLFPFAPRPFIEAWFARGIFPKVSTILGLLADSIPIAWLDLLIPAALVYAGFCIRWRRWAALVVMVAAGFVTFFWTWGINYHREPLRLKLTINSNEASASLMEAFTRRTATELNALYKEDGSVAADSDIASVAAERVEQVVERLDGLRWRAASRIKISILADPWFRAAGIDGFFNPIIHEPILNSRVLPVERPFVVAHELAHVRGYPDEGDANFIALMATLMSQDRRLQYSGWIELWFYLRGRDSDRMLDSGPRQDVQRILERIRRQQVAWISTLQATILDWFLKANSVPSGIRSYSQVVLLAAETQDTWSRFR